MAVKLELIEDYLVAGLQSINGTGGFVNTVATINRRTVNKLAEVSRGAAEVFVDIESIEGAAQSGGTMGTRGRSAVFTITGQVTIPADALKSKAAMHSLSGDIVRMLEADPRCGGLTGSLSWRMRPVIGAELAQCVFTVTVTFTEAKT